MGHFSKECCLCCTSAKYQQGTVKGFTEACKTKARGLSRQPFEKQTLAGDVFWEFDRKCLTEGSKL
jgi:hypothetical protein